jgi:CBS domain-containing protein
MSVGSICSRNVATIGLEDSVREAAVLMREEHVGDLIVVEHRDGRPIPVGVITDRDIVLSVVAKGVALDDVTVGDAMSADLLTVNEANGVEHALREMGRVGVRRAPVIDSDGRLVGVLSIDDVIDHLAAQLGHIADVIRHGQETEVRARP